MNDAGTVLVTGASGFVGRRLAAALVDAGHHVRAMTRNPDTYQGSGDAVFGDVHEADSLTEALAACTEAYYLVHSLHSEDFKRLDAEAAEAFGRAAASAGVRQIIYLGGLGRSDDELSDHLRSRREVEKLLGSSGVRVTVLRAGMVIGAGGLSWEMTRQLVDHLPVMVTPKGVRTRTQPIAIHDVVRYLVGVLRREEALDQVYEVGGPEVMRYADLMRRVAASRRRPLLLMPVPLLTAGLSSRWLSLVTDVDTQSGRSLIDSMSNEVIVEDDRIRDLVPFEPVGFDEAVRLALAER